MARPKGPPTDVVSARLPQEVADELRAEAEARGIPLNVLLGQMILARRDSLKDSGIQYASHPREGQLCKHCKLGVVKRGRCTACRKPAR